MSSNRTRGRLTADQLLDEQQRKNAGNREPKVCVFHCGQSPENRMEAPSSAATQRPVQPTIHSKRPESCDIFIALLVGGEIPEFFPFLICDDINNVFFQPLLVPLAHMQATPQIPWDSCGRVLGFPGVEEKTQRSEPLTSKKAFAERRPVHRGNLGCTKS